MATSLAERLEALSGYRHVTTPGHRGNPIVFSHLILKVGGQRLHVLSRIADAGLDYSQRTNKLAHHVALATNELSPAGPAWVLAQPGFSETAWTGTSRILSAGRKAPTGSFGPQVCRAWEKVTGDAGVLLLLELESRAGWVSLT
jgi:GTPase-associated protein 1